MVQRIQQRGDTAANWTAANPVLLARELGYETDTGRFKVGDGATAWSSLAYLPFTLGVPETQARLKQVAPNVYGGSVTATLADSASLVAAAAINSAAAAAFTIPPGVFPVGDAVNVVQLGTGQITLTPGAGVTIQTAAPGLRTKARWSMATVWQYAANTWIAGGDLA